RFIFFFFFQAEDGIRDRTVTGVQTCALPISKLGGCICRSDVHCAVKWKPAAQRSNLRQPCATRLRKINHRRKTNFARLFADDRRSEERRVGKECRSARTKDE